MYNRFSMNFVNSATKFYSKVFIQQVQCKFIGLQCNFSIQTPVLVTRGYSDDAHTTKFVHQNYASQYEKELNELIQEPKYKTMYDKCKLEVEYWKNFYNIPSKLTAQNWLILLQTPTISQRRKYLEFLWKVEKKGENQLKKKQLKALQKSEEVKEEDDSAYGLSKVAMFYRIREKTINQFYNSRLISAMLFEPIVVFDLGYEEHMTPYEQFNCAKQLLLSFSVNRGHEQPFNLYFCNVNRNCVALKKLHTTMPALYDDDFPLHITSKSYLDIFDKEKLVYLSPHANQVMTKYDPNAIYIIGALIDKIDRRPHSFKKAQKEGIKMLKLPLGQNLDWGSGSGKNLPFNQVLSILLELRHTGNWSDAFAAHVPKRKLKASREYNMKKLILKKQRMSQYLERKK